jgi:dihydroneopterin aldolase
MEQPSKLLETVAEKIVNDVFSNFPSVKSVQIKISKLNPPIGGKCKKATVSLSKERL